MLKKRFNSMMAATIIPIIICSCTPLVPDNYLGPVSVQRPHKINGKYVKTRVIPISVDMLNSKEGQILLAPAMQPQPYRIGAFDNLNVIVWGHPDISTVATNQVQNTITTSSLDSSLPNPLVPASNMTNPAVLVDSKGSIFYPYVGHLKVSGLTIDEAQQKLTQRLSRYIRNPQVTVQVAKYRNRNIYVLGEVRKPGMQALSDKPLSLIEAISNAGDINPITADPSHVYLVRGSYSDPEIFCLNAQSPQSLLIAEQFPLEENDIVYISAASLTGINNFVNQILPSLSTYTIAHGLAN